VLAYGEWVEANVLAPVPHRQYVFTIPRVLRPMFARRRALLGKLCNIIERIFDRAYASTRPGARAGIILFVQTFGDLVNFNPHIHVLAADGAFDGDGGFTVLAPIPSKVLEPWFRAEVLALLRCEGMVSEVLAEKMLAWRHTGFSAHNSVRVRARDAAGRRRLAQYMLRAPFSLEKMSYDPESCVVIYRSRMHRTLKRNFEIMQQTVAELSESMQAMASPEAPQAKATKQAEMVKKTYERAVTNMKELGEMIQHANAEAVEVLNKRFTEAMDEVKSLAQKAK